MKNIASSRDQNVFTKNQHFVSQVEQRLNAVNPAARRENQRIYTFEIVDRDRREIRLSNGMGRLIANSLSMFDLFSLDVDGDGTRANFERIFSEYEARLGQLTNRLLKAHANKDNAVGQDIFDLFVAKMVNFIRNPYSVAKILNTFGALAQYHPTDPAIYATYERILTGRRPQQAYLCKKLGISDDQYGAWLRVLFLLLTPMVTGHGTFLDQSLQSLFEDRGTGLLVHMHTFSVERCLLSDRGWTVPVPEKPHLVFDFNLTAQAFIRYAFLDYKAVLGHPVPPHIRHGLTLGPKVAQLSYLHDDSPRWASSIGV